MLKRKKCTKGLLRSIQLIYANKERERERERHRERKRHRESFQKTGKRKEKALLKMFTCGLRKRLKHRL